MRRTDNILFFTELGLTHALNWTSEQVRDMWRRGEMLPDRFVSGQPIWAPDSVMALIVRANRPRPGVSAIEVFSEWSAAYARGVVMGAVYGEAV